METSSALPFTVFSYEEVASRFLPPQSNIQAEIGELRDNLPSPLVYKSGFAIGLIITLGSVFALLAAHQVLPHGLNAFSQLNPYGYVIGYGAFAIGVGTLVISVKKHILHRRVSQEIGIKEDSQTSEENTRSNSVLYEDIKDKLLGNQALAFMVHGSYCDYLAILTKDVSFFPSETFKTSDAYETWKNEIQYSHGYGQIQPKGLLDKATFINDLNMLVKAESENL